jgi:hypothetical protein
MSDHIDRIFIDLWQLSATPGRAAEANPSAALEVNVIFTDSQGTVAALKTAGALARNLGASINLLDPQVVPLAFPLTSPPVSIEFSEQRLFDLVSQGAQGPLDTSVRLLLCRDRRQCLLQALKPQSLVVIAGRKSWWPTKEQKLAEILQSEGHQVLFARLK